MAARTLTCVVLACDCCGNDIEGYDYTPHFPDAAEARDQFRDEHETWTDGTVDICEPCKLDDHAFVPSENPLDDCCDRCGIEKDEHEKPTGRPCPNRRPVRGPSLPHTHDPDGDGTDDCAACTVADEAAAKRREDRA